VNRALRAATMGVLLLSTAALTACSAGQVTQTASQNRDKTGGQASVGNIDLRAVQLAYPRGDAYESGDDADLLLAIVNDGGEDDTLTDISGDGFGGYEIEDDTAASSSGSSSGSSSTQTDLDIPANSAVIVDGENITITLTDLDEDLTVAQPLELTFTFRNAGEVTLPVTVANPTRDVPRGESFDFHGDEGTE
jgi:copper(I)-binding protein